MPQQVQTGSISAPRTRQALDALIQQRNEMQGQLRALEDRRHQLADQRMRLDDNMGRDVERRVKVLDGNIDRLERQISTANELVTAGHARFGGGAEAAVASEQSALAEQARAMAEQVAAAVEAARAGGGSGSLVPPPQADASGQVVRAMLVEGVVLVLLGAIAWVWAMRRLERKLSGRGATTAAGDIRTLQQSVDAIALEVERISENQRWVTKVINDKALGAGEARPMDVAGDRVPSERKV